jgi:hypothetical protein
MEGSGSVQKKIRFRIRNTFYGVIKCVSYVQIQKHNVNFLYLAGPSGLLQLSRPGGDRAEYQLRNLVQASQEVRLVSQGNLEMKLNFCHSIGFFSRYFHEVGIHKWPAFRKISASI